MRCLKSFQMILLSDALGATPRDYLNLFFKDKYDYQKKKVSNRLCKWLSRFTSSTSFHLHSLFLDSLHPSPSGLLACSVLPSRPVCCAYIFPQTGSNTYSLNNSICLTPKPPLPLSVNVEATTLYMLYMIVLMNFIARGKLQQTNYQSIEIETQGGHWRDKRYIKRIFMEWLSKQRNIEIEVQRGFWSAHLTIVQLYQLTSHLIGKVNDLYLILFLLMYANAKTLMLVEGKVQSYYIVLE